MSDHGARRGPEKPYKFLDSYGLDDAPIFFGREREARVLLSDVVVNRLVVLFAPSGTGKTSLINAGVRPRLHQKGYETFFIRVNQDPIASAIAKLREHPALASMNGGSFRAKLERAVETLTKPIVLFFDQFEEFFIYVLRPDPAAGRRFIDDVAHLYRNRDSGVHLVFSMREEFFVEMDVFRDDIPTIFHNESNLRLRPFSPDQAREAIVQPARVFGADYEPALVEQLIEDLSATASAEHRSDAALIEPAQLQIVCDLLWEQHSGSITLEQYRKLGGDSRRNVAQQVLYERIERAFESLGSAEEFDLLARLLLELRTTQGTKYVRDVPGLVRALSTGAPEVSETAVRSLLDLLDRSHFIKRSRRDALEVVELSHDYLVSQLDELARRVRLIRPRRKLAETLQLMSHGTLATQEQLGEAAAAVPSATLTADEGWFLFASALHCGYVPDVWFKIAAARGADVWHKLQQLVADPAEPIARLSHVIDLCERILRGSGVADADHAFAVLDAAIERDDLTIEAQEALAKLGGVPKPGIPAAAADRLIAFLDRTLETGRVASSAVVALGRIERPQSVHLLQRALRRDDLSFEAQAALAVSTMALTPEIASQAIDVLCDFLDERLGHGRVFPGALQPLARVETRRSIQLLERALREEPLASAAKSALERLAASAVADIQKGARAALSRGFRRGTTPVSDAPPSMVRSDFAPASPRRPVSQSSASESVLAAIAQFVQRSGCVMLAGAGVHAPPPAELAHLYPQPERPPLRAELLRQLAEYGHFDLDVRDELSPSRVLELFEYRFTREKLIAFLKESLVQGRRPSPIVRAIARLPFRVFLTTNVDRLLETALVEAGKSPVIVTFDKTRSPQSERVELSDGAPLVVKLQGDLDSKLVLTDDDFTDFVFDMAGEEGLPPVVRRELSQSALLVCGMRLNDYRNRFVLRSISRLTSGLRRSGLYAVDPFAGEEILDMIERSYKGRIVREDLWQFVPALLERVTGDTELLNATRSA
jgi:hypothetical protein